MSYLEDVKEVIQIRIVIDGGMVDTVDAFADSLSGIVGRRVEVEVVDRDVEDDEDSGIDRFHLVTKEKIPVDNQHQRATVVTHTTQQGETNA